MFAYKGAGYYFANVKIEKSDSQSYAQDKVKVISSLRLLSSTKQATTILSADKIMMDGFEHYGADRDVIDVGQVMGTHVLFYDPGYLVITVYFLNQEKKNRRFNSIEEYRVLRDDFLNRYTKCLKSLKKQ